MCRSRKPVYRQRYRGFESLPLRCKTLVFPGLLAFLANCFGLPACSRMSMPAGAEPSCALSWNLLSRQSRLRTLVFPGETGGFAAERKNRVNSVRRFEFFQPIAVLAAARYCGAATTYSLLSPNISNASSRIGRSSGKIGQLRMPRHHFPIDVFPT